MSNSVLVADDNPAIRSLLVRLIRRTRPHARIVDVESACAALEAYRRERPTLVLLDHGLPDMSGFSVLQQIKVQSQAPYVIMITGNPSLVEEARAHGADDVWLKPMDVAAMLQQLRIILPTA